MSGRSGNRLEVMTKERDELLRSLEDLLREHGAGDIDDADFERLRRTYVARTSALLAEMERAASGAERPIRPSFALRLRRWLGRRRVRSAVMALFALWLAAAIGTAALHFSGVRLPGQAATGTVSLSQALTIRQQLSEASQLSAKGQPAQAIALYSEVLAKVPNQRQALTFEGWLLRLTGIEAHRRDLIAKGDAELAQAVAVAPDYAEARALYAIALAGDQRGYERAVGELRAFLADHPGKGLIVSLRPSLVSIFHHAKLAVPAEIQRS